MWASNDNRNSSNWFASLDLKALFFICLCTYIFIHSVNNFRLKKGVKLCLGAVPQRNMEKVLQRWPLLPSNSECLGVHYQNKDSQSAVKMPRLKLHHLPWEQRGGLKNSTSRWVPSRPTLSLHHLLSLPVGRLNGFILPNTKNPPGTPERLRPVRSGMCSGEKWVCSQGAGRPAHSLSLRKNSVCSLPTLRPIRVDQEEKWL